MIGTGVTIWQEILEQNKGSGGTPPETDDLLLESGNFFLLETSDKLLLET